MTPAVAKALEDQGSYWSTYGWHPRSVAVAIANLRNLQRDRARLLAHVATMSAYFAERLAQMPFREAPRLRIKGLAIAVGVGDEGYAAKIGKHCQGNGLLVSVQDENLLLLPALNVDADVAREGLDRLEASL